jgi:hypothetical protein
MLLRMADAAVIPRRRPRILMLHGWTQNATLFSEKAGAFRKKLRDVADLHFAEAPFIVCADDAGGRENARSWWTIAETTTEPPFRRPFVGWNESRAYLASLWESAGPFDGIVGFSQGAVAAHQLVSEVTSWVAGSIPTSDCEPIARQPPRFAVFICGFPSALAIPSAAADARLPFRSLHVVADGDQVVPPELQRELASCFTDPVVLSIDKGHAMPQRASDLAVVVGFVLGALPQAAAASS